MLQHEPIGFKNFPHATNGMQGFLHATCTTLFNGLHYLIPTISHLKAFGQTVHKLRFKTRISAAAELCRQSTQPSLLLDKTLSILISADPSFQLKLEGQLRPCEALTCLW